MRSHRDIAAFVVVAVPVLVALSQSLDHGLTQPIERAMRMGHLFSQEHVPQLLFVVVACLAAGGVAALVASFKGTD